MTRSRTAVVATLVALALALVGCGDDGADVRNIGEDGEGTGTGATGTGATGTGATGTGATGTEATGTEASEVACRPVGDPADADESVDVTLTEWSVEPEPTEVSAGGIAFEATNEGSTAHELVVVRADSAEDLPTDEDGALDEEALDEGQLIGEIPKFPAGEDCTGVFDLEPATYVLLCNVSDGTPHLEQGMHAEFTVTG